MSLFAILLVAVLALALSLLPLVGLDGGFGLFAVGCAIAAVLFWAGAGVAGAVLAAVLAVIVAVMVAAGAVVLAVLAVPLVLIVVLAAVLLGLAPLLLPVAVVVLLLWLIVRAASAPRAPASAAS